MLLQKFMKIAKKPWFMERLWALISTGDDVDTVREYVI